MYRNTIFLAEVTISWPYLILRVRGSVKVGTDNRDNQYCSPTVFNETSPFAAHFKSASNYS